MKWFDRKEFDTVRKFIDAGNNANTIRDWYWNSDFKNNATTLAMAFIYNIMNTNKCSMCAKALKDLLSPKGKTGPLVYNDVVSEIWNHDNTKAINSLNILIDNNIPFAIKNGDVLAEFLTNPKLSKVTTAIEQNPEYISKYMKKKGIGKSKTNFVGF